MMGMEDGAVLVNQLMRQLGNDPSASLDPTQIERAFIDTQSTCEPRSRKLMRESFLTESMHAWKNPLLKFAVLNLVPKLGFDFVLAQFVEGVRPAPIVETLPRPCRDSLVGFDDDHSDTPSILRTLMKCLTYLSIVLCGVWALVHPNAPSISDPRFAQADVLYRLDMSSILTIMLIEGWRRSNKLSILQWPMVWALLADLFGFQIVSPFFYLANYWTNSQRGRLRWTAINRPMNLPAAKAIFPAVTLFYILPTASRSLLGYFNTTAELNWNDAISAWPTATCAAIVTLAFSLISNETDTFFGKKYLGHLRMSYKCMFALLTLLHLGSLAWQIRNDYLFWSLPARLAEFVWLLATYSEISHYHHVRQHAVLNVTLITMAFLVAGPGATAAAVWHWREGLDEEIRPKTRLQLA